jgi:RNA polymerase sigma-70 factor (ECF subfamily)
MMPFIDRFQFRWENVLMTTPADSSGNGQRLAYATSPSLLVRVQANQAGAWERLVDLYAPLVYHWCRRAQLTPEDTADVFQEIFRSVAEHIARFRRDRPGDSFRGWLRTIARTKICDQVRRLVGQPRAAGGTSAQLRFQAVADPAVADPLLESDASEVDLIHQQIRRTLEAIRGEFEERTWQAFWKVQMENQVPSDVAAELGMTAPAVRKAKLRVFARLRQELGELLE